MLPDYLSPRAQGISCANLLGKAIITIIEHCNQAISKLIKLIFHYDSFADISVCQ